ncbi:MAG: signal recognition particle-docking protein FtsY [Candidatus Aenigmarchaeota archaeon]|nr:signal recognition particle-docking protein FtsY [Candidatus Aenigmarchaeota archaeon]
MFDSLKKKLQQGVKKLTKKVADKEDLSFEQEEQFLHEKTVEVEQVIKEEPEKIEEEKEAEEHFEAEPPPETKEPVQEETLADRELPEPKETMEDEVIKKEEKLEKRGFLKKVRGIPAKVREKELSPGDIDEFISDIESDLIYSNVALNAIDSFKEALKKELVDQKIKRGKTQEVLQEAFEKSLLKIVDQGSVDLDSLPKPTTLLFLGFNGSGKTTSTAKVAHHLQNQGKKVVLAAADTFRAASIEQLEVHGKKLKAKVIKHQYGSDAAAVVFDAKKHAKANKIDYVLADTAGRTHVDKNLIDELKKVVRVNKPDLKVLVIDSLTGNDAVEQAVLFDKAVGVDAILLTKLDVNKKGGSILSVSWAIKKPVLFLGTGQDYKDLVAFKPKEFVKELLE